MMQSRWTAVALAAVVAAASVLAAGIADERRPVAQQDCVRCHAADPGGGFVSSAQILVR